MLGLRVVQATGSPITLGQAVVRNFLRFIDGMPLFTYCFGLTSCMATKRFQRLGDLAAGTVVIYDRLPPMPVIAMPPPIAPVPLPVGLTADEMRALALFRERAGSVVGRPPGGNRGPGVGPQRGDRRGGRQPPDGDGALGPGKKGER